MSTPDFLEATVGGGYVHHAVRNEPKFMHRPAAPVMVYIGRTLCRRGANGVRVTLDGQGQPVPYEFKEHHCEICMARVSQARKEPR